MLRIFMSVKIQRLRPGLNPQTWVPEASMLTTRPPKSSAQWLRRCATSWPVLGSIPGGVTWDFFRGSFNKTMCPEVDSASENEYQ